MSSAFFIPLVYSFCSQLILLYDYMCFLNSLSLGWTMLPLLQVQPYRIQLCIHYDQLHGIAMGILYSAVLGLRMETILLSQEMRSVKQASSFMSGRSQFATGLKSESNGVMSIRHTHCITSF